MRIAIDYDGVLVPFGPLTDDVTEPPKNLIDAINELSAIGHEIIIFTSRFSQVWWSEDWQKFGASDPEAFGSAQMHYVHEKLRSWGLKYSRVTSEKIPCHFYFDDRAVRISDDYPLDVALKEWIK